MSINFDAIVEDVYYLEDQYQDFDLVSIVFYCNFGIQMRIQ